MENYQIVQNRSQQTVAVINQYMPTLKVGGQSATDLTTAANALDTLAQTRDDALSTADQANNAENLAYLGIRTLDISLPQAAEAELNDDVPEEAGLISQLDPVYAITPQTTELALARGRKLVSALKKIDAYLAALPTPRGPVKAGGKGATDLETLLNAHPALEQADEDAQADVNTARSNLRQATRDLDRLNKRFYQKLDAESRTNAALADALAQIITDSSNQPGTLGIKGILQGGTDNLHLLVSYDAGSYDGTADSKIEWQVVGIDADFTHSAKADPSGNALGAFAVGQTVKIRTRVTNANGTTTGSVRTITITAPVL
jgi:hypothetical protein